MKIQKLIEKRRTVRKYAEGNTVSKEEGLAMIGVSQEATS